MLRLATGNFQLGSFSYIAALPWGGMLDRSTRTVGAHSAPNRQPLLLLNGQGEIPRPDSGGPPIPPLRGRGSPLSWAKHLRSGEPSCVDPRAVETPESRRQRAPGTGLVPPVRQFNYARTRPNRVLAPRVSPTASTRTPIGGCGIRAPGPNPVLIRMPCEFRAFQRARPIPNQLDWGGG